MSIQPKPQSPEPVARRAYSIADFCRAYSVSRSYVYEQMAAGRLRSVRIGGRRFIPIEAAEAFLSDNGGAQ